MTILYSKSRLKVSYLGDGVGGRCHLGWGPIPMIPAPRWLVKRAVQRLRRQAA